MTDETDPRFGEAIELFNNQEFFACHDVLEEIWNETPGPERRFYQGIIHAAVALFHFGEGNLGGARKMYSSANSYLTPYSPECLGIDIEALIADLARCFHELARPHAAYPHGLVLDARLIPTIRRRDR